MLVRDLGNLDADVRHAAVHVGQHRTPSSAMRLTSRNALARPGSSARRGSPRRPRSAASAAGLADRNDRLEQRALAVLDILAHRVQVGRQRDAGREDALALLALALAVELFPPLVDILQLRLVAEPRISIFLPPVVERCCARRRRRLPDSPRKRRLRPWPSPSPARRGPGPRCPRRRRPAAAGPRGSAPRSVRPRRRE